MKANALLRKPFLCLLGFTMLCVFLFYKAVRSSPRANFSRETVVADPLQKPPKAHRKPNPDNATARERPVPRLAIVTCGDRLSLTLMNVKSAVAFSRSRMHIMLFADPPNMDSLLKELSTWPREILQRVTVQVRQVTFPGSFGEKWKKLFKLCASQRLFLPSLLPDVDALIYVDADVLFLRPIEDLWDIFSQMNSSHIAGLTPETEDYATNWYKRFARHPYVPPLGVNSGVMLMNLTRMRAFNWDSRLEPILLKYERNISWGDQDVINIIFHDHQDKLLIFPCHWNFRPDHCWYGPTCPKATPAVVHGNRNAFADAKKEPAFRAIYDAIQQFELGSSLVRGFVMPLKRDLQRMTSTYCGKELLRHIPEWREIASRVDAAS